MVVVDDDPMVCAHLRTILESAGNIRVVEVAHDGAAGLDAVIRHQPDLALMDLRMPGVDGLVATTRIIALPKPPVVVALTTFDADRYILAALRAGAAGYLLKSTPPRTSSGWCSWPQPGTRSSRPAQPRDCWPEWRGRPCPTG
ncbi:response regulator [Phytohabitans suffuscus]